MIIKAHALPVKRQAQLLDISRSNVYYLPVPTSEKDLALMRAIDEVHLEYPFLGARQLRKILAREGHPRAGRLHIGTLMQNDGHYGAVPQTQYQQAASGAQGLPVPAAPPRHRAGEPRLGHGHHLFADATWLHLPGGRHGLGDAASAGVAGVEYADG